MTLNEAIRAATRWAEKQTSPDGVAALAYLRALPGARADYGVEGVRVQFLYVLNNVGGWRGPEAREAKNLFKLASRGKINV